MIWRSIAHDLPAANELVVAAWYDPAFREMCPIELTRWPAAGWPSSRPVPTHWASWNFPTTPCADHARIVNETVERIARFLERGTHCAALERIKVGGRNAIARKVRDLFKEESS